MEFDNAFEVPLPPAQAWEVLLDISRIAPCMPGAELTEVIDERTYKGRISVRLGPVALTFAGTVRFEDIDAANHRARVKGRFPSVGFLQPAARRAILSSIERPNSPRKEKTWLRSREPASRGSDTPQCSSRPPGAPPC
jgi:hypothetical protein